MSISTFAPSCVKPSHSTDSFCTLMRKGSAFVVVAQLANININNHLVLSDFLSSYLLGLDSQDFKCYSYKSLDKLFACGVHKFTFRSFSCPSSLVTYLHMTAGAEWLVPTNDPANGVGSAARCYCANSSRGKERTGDGLLSTHLVADAVLCFRGFRFCLSRQFWSKSSF